MPAALIQTFHVNTNWFHILSFCFILAAENFKQSCASSFRVPLNVTLKTHSDPLSTLEHLNDRGRGICIDRQCDWGGNKGAKSAGCRGSNPELSRHMSISHHITLTVKVQASYFSRLLDGESTGCLSFRINALQFSLKPTHRGYREFALMEVYKQVQVFQYSSDTS